MNEILIYIVLPISILISVILSWYVKRLLNIIEDSAVEIKERFGTFHEFLQETYKMDLFYGEPRLKELLDIVKEFDSWAEEFENRIIKEEKYDGDVDNQEKN